MPFRLIPALLFMAVVGAVPAEAVPMPTPRPHVPAQSIGNPPPPPSAQRPVPSMSATPPSMPRVTGDPSPLSERDKSLTKEALSLIARNQFGDALARQLAIQHPLGRGVVEFFYVRDRARDAGYRRIADFLAAYPDWPSRDLLRLRLAQDMMDENAPPSEVLRLLGNDPPTGSGHIVVAAALAASGRPREAQALARAAWYRDDLDPDQERWAMQRLGPLLTADDHRRRMDMYFYRDRSSDALRIAGYLGSGWKAYADARAAVIKRSGNAGRLLDAVPRAQRDQPGYVFARIQYLRRSGKELEAAALLANAPKSRDALVDPDAWWVERRLAARALLDEGRATDAYNISAGHSAVDSGDYAEAEFHAGWIALRFLNDPRRAAAHFANIAGVATIPSTRARAAYWLGRASEASGDMNAAITHYRRAAADPSAFYGQLAAAKLSQRRLDIPRPPNPSTSAARAFEARDGVRAIRLLAEIGYNSLVGPMLYDMADSSRSAEETVLIAALAADLGYTDMVVHAGKRGQANGYSVDRVAFPVNGVPKFKPLSETVEPALVHAISRQESLFNPRARSQADARGLMQLLPSTAASVAKRNGVSYSQDRLYDPTYNAQLGAAYLGEGINRYNGSYILAIAAYNAGRGRADEWIERFGDPRSPRVDPIDWIERIPFTETREYVQKVLENLQFYRAILPGVDGTLSIATDLQRGS